MINSRCILYVCVYLPLATGGMRIPRVSTPDSRGGAPPQQTRSEPYIRIPPPAYRPRLSTTPERPTAFFQSQSATDISSSSSPDRRLQKRFSSPPDPLHSYSSSPQSYYPGLGQGSTGASYLQSPLSYHPPVSVSGTNVSWSIGPGGGLQYGRENSGMSEVSEASFANENENEQEYVQEQQQRFQQFEETRKETGTCMHC